MHSTHYHDNVFINCPFDSAYKPLFDAIVFAVHDCGFVARCALEEGDASQVRIDKIYNIIEDCRYGIHDISRTELDEVSGLPRFNMPLELGIFLGAKRFGVEDQDNPEEVVRVVRDWLRTSSERQRIPGGGIIWRHYQDFLNDLPQLAQRLQLEIEDFKFFNAFNDYTFAIAEWLSLQPRSEP